MLRATLLEIQVLYWMPLPGCSDEALQRNLTSTYSTSEALVKLGLDLEHACGFLSHAPHHVFRSLLLAACTVIQYLRSPFATSRLVSVGGTDPTVQDAIRALKTCSVQADDLPTRASNMMQGYWNIKARLPPWDISQLRTAKFKHRLGASIVFECFARWKKDLDWTRLSAGDSSHAGGLPESHSGRPPPPPPTGYGACF